MGFFFLFFIIIVHFHSLTSATHDQLVGLLSGLFVLTWRAMNRIEESFGNSVAHNNFDKLGQFDSSSNC